jgi:hemerythrin-like domain-containing protein
MRSKWWSSGMPQTVDGKRNGANSNLSRSDVDLPRPMSRADLRITLDRNFKSQLSLCALLENIADSLPNNVSRNNCLLAARNIEPIVQSAHAFEEQYLFPLLLADKQKQEKLKPVLARLHAEHCEDESYSNEVIDALEELAADQLANIDKLSYMLRGFFEGLRRHIAFEQEHLLPLLNVDTNPR